jgi:hypothetical protein
MPEVGPSPDFGRNIDLALDKRAMFMQAWGTYGTIWPVVHQQLGVRPDLGMRRLAVVPQIPPGQRSVGGTDITLGSGSMDVAASHDGSAYTTVVDTRLGGALSIGVTLPANTTVGAATLDGAPATYTVNDTHAGREVLVATTCGARHTLVVTMR